MHTDTYDLRSIAAQFAIPGTFLSAAPYGSGHINDTYASTFEQGSARVRYIHQRINEKIFRQPALLMDNIARVLAHQHRRLAGADPAHRRALTLVPTHDGRLFHQDPQGLFWRTYLFIEDAATYDVVQSPAMARHAARAFGEFQKQLADLPPPRLGETIPRFHDTPWRFHALEEAIAADAAHRAGRARAEIDFALARQHMTGLLLRAFQQGEIPERITHNDTKLNNVMMDTATGAGICVIDLDTVMPGLVHYDFGDMVRTAARAGAEDEPDLARVGFQDEMFEALTRGYLESAGEFLTPAERRLLAASGIVITFEIGIRFLADYLAGDVYFKTHRPDHNLDRCRTQFKMVREMEERREWMEAIVARGA